jgi:hypothetical protein
MVSGIWRSAGAALVAFTLVALEIGCSSDTARSPTGTGGQQPTGGSSGTGGSAGTTGAGGMLKGDAAVSDAAAPFVTLFDFATAAQTSAAAVANPSDSNTADLGVHPSSGDAGGLATVAWDKQVGSPAPGSLQIHLPCEAYGQFVDYQLILPIISDMGGKTLSVMLRLDSGFSPDATAPGFVLLYAKSGDNWDWGQAAAVPVAPSSAGPWIQYTMKMSAPATGSSTSFDPGYVKAVGVQLNTGAGAGAAAPPTPATFHLDTIGVQ